jgi:hypothetical protein
MRTKHIIVFVLAFLGSILFVTGCSLSTSSTTSTTTTTTLAPTAIQVSVSISREKDDYDSTNKVSYWVSITDNGTSVGTATVTINGVNVPVVGGFTYSYELYDYSSPAAAYAPGTTYTVVVTYGGKTYTDSMTAPGGVTVNSDSSQASWSYNGNASTVSVNQHGYAGTDTFSRSDSGGNLTNPVNIPSSAYPYTSVSYDLRMNIKTSKQTFASLSGPKTYLMIYDFWLKKVSK